MGERCPNERGAGAGGRGAGGRRRRGSRHSSCRQLIVDAGPDAVARFLEFFAATDRERENAGGVRAGRGAVSGVVRGPRPPPGRRWPRSTSPPTSGPTPGSVPTVKQHLAAIRVLCDWLVVNQVLRVNPASAVRGPKHVVTKGATPVLTPAEARKLLEHIDTGTLAGLRDRALFSVMLYSFARVSAVLGMRRQDYFQQGSRGWLRLHEKGGKRHDVPAHHRAAEALDAYLEAAGLEDGREALFQSVDRVGERLSGRPLTRRVVLAMIKRRAATAGLPPSTCCHTFRATGITAYLSNGGTLEHAQQIAGHASPKDDEALRPDGRHGDGRRDRTHRDLNESAQTAALREKCALVVQGCLAGDPRGRCPGIGPRPAADLAAPGRVCGCRGRLVPGMRR